MFIRTWIKSSLFLLGMLVTLAGVLHSEEVKLDSTIPVLDMRDYYNPATRKQFYKSVSKALHEVGFFAVVNPGLDMHALENGYVAIKQFFNAPLPQKREILRPELSGQRGYVPSETPQGFSKIDFKEFLHVGRYNNVWPDWMDLQGPTEDLMAVLDIFSENIQKALAFGMGKPENFLIEMTKKGECILRPIHYPANPEPGQYWAGEHTDIDLFTILPMATEDGLQLYHEGKWVDIKVPPNAFIVNAGDKLMNMTNGYFKSGKHRVVSKRDHERYSIVYFIHPRDEDDMSPLPYCIERTTGYPQFPNASSWELLAVRLRELKLASSAWLNRLETCGINERIEKLAISGKAHPTVKRTYEIWQDWLLNKG